MRTLRPRPPVVAVIALLVLAAAASAYYPFVHYTTSAAPYEVAPEKFDLSALPNRTLYYFVSSRGPDKLAAGDSFNSILSQIRLAARAWSEVGTSALRFEFGGLAATDVAQFTPGVDVFFGEVELPPGLIALGGPTTRSSLTSSEDGPFVPITRSILVLGRDLSQRPSYSDPFFLTVVHELGHALGLQHTLTSAAMSTEVTRSVSRAKPLAADDEMGISLLYPSENLSRLTGSISGRVTLDGVGVHLASVVALQPASGAVGALTDPDGQFKIRGLAPGTYYLYVHPLPLAVQTGLGPADIVLPSGPDGLPVAPGPLFQTVFHPGVRVLAQASSINVQAGQAVGGFDFAVKARGAALDIYGVTTYSFPGNIAVKPAFVNSNGTRRYLVAYGKGLITNNAPSPGLLVSTLGGGVTVPEDGVKAYVPAPSFLQVGFWFHPFSSEGPRHLVFSLNDDLFVLPSALHQVRSQPPAIAKVTGGFGSDGLPLVIMAGSNLTRTTGVLFDGLPSKIVSQDDATGELTVVPPAGASGHHAVVTALDADGQDSLFLNANNPPTYAYPVTAAPLLLVSPSVLPAGAESMVEITGTNTSFADGQTLAGFGVSDVVVRKVWVLGPGRMWANVHVAPGAAQKILPLTAVTGFQTAMLASGLQIQPARAGLPIVNPVPANPETGQPSIFAGGKAVLIVDQLPAGSTAASVSLTVGDLSAAVQAVQDRRVVFVVPSGLSIGPAVLRLTAGGQAAAPIVVAIDPAPPTIQAVTDLSERPIGPNLQAVVGGDLLVRVSGVADPAVLADPSRLVVSIGGVPQVPLSVVASDAVASSYLVRIEISDTVAPGASVPIIVAVGYRVSQPVLIPIKAVD